MMSRATYSLQLRARRRAVDESANATPGFDSERMKVATPALSMPSSVFTSDQIDTNGLASFLVPEFGYILRRKAWWSIRCGSGWRGKSAAFCPSMHIRGPPASRKKMRQQLKTPGLGNTGAIRALHKSDVMYRY